jgi:hypothetical protein
MTRIKSFAGAIVVCGLASTVSAEVQVSMRDGRVTIVATDATVRQILSEWARVGQTKIVNVERIPGGPVTLQLTNVPEQEALDLLLKSVTGYMAAPRAVVVAGLSRYDRILVLPTAAVNRVPVVAPPTPVAFQQPAIQQQPDVDAEGPSIPPTRGPLFPTQPRVVIDQQREVPMQGGATNTPGVVSVQPAPATGPTFNTPPPTGATVGTPRPGMVVQPQQGPPGVIDIQRPEATPDN